jgi:hypothetical protein
VSPPPIDGVAVPPPSEEPSAVGTRPLQRARGAPAESPKGCSISRREIFEDLLGLRFRMRILSKSLVTEESDQLLLRLFGV